MKKNLGVPMAVNVLFILCTLHMSVILIHLHQHRQIVLRTYLKSMTDILVQLLKPINGAPLTPPPFLIF